MFNCRVQLHIDRCQVDALSFQQFLSFCDQEERVPQYLFRRRSYSFPSPPEHSPARFQSSPSARFAFHSAETRPHRDSPAPFLPLDQIRSLHVVLRGFALLRFRGERPGRDFPRAVEELHADRRESARADRHRDDAANPRGLERQGGLRGRRRAQTWIECR